MLHGGVGTGKTFLGTGIVLLNLRSGRSQAVNWNMVAPEGVCSVDLRKDEEGNGWNSWRKWAKESGEWYPGQTYLYRYDDLWQTYGVEDADIYHDEAQNTTGARDWESMPKHVRAWLSEHRHYGLNIVFFTQHYKFVDVYFRRLATEVWEVWRLLNLSFMSPCPDADSETGEPGRSKILGLRAIRRPWRDLERWWPIPSLTALWKTSIEVPGAFDTRARSHLVETTENGKTRGRGGAPPAAPIGGARKTPRPDTTQDELPFR